MSQVFPEFRAV